MDFLTEIINVKRQRLAAAKARLPIDRIRDLAGHRRGGSHRLTDALRDKSRPNIIAEFKRRSPSKGSINLRADAPTMAEIYESAGAAAISVLTEEDYFDGSLEDLRRIREVTRLPILRKDFIVDEYQIYESAAAGADALLLIVAALDDAALTRLRGITEEELGMDALVEVHTIDELRRAVDCGARLIGVNNRDLRTFDVSTATSTLLARAAPRDVCLISESGLTPAEVRRLRTIGYRGFLIGEALMRAADPVQAISDFLGELEQLPPRSVFVKICGITNPDDAGAAVDAGADLLGLNFFPRSPRFIEAKAAREIVDVVRSKAQTKQRAITVVGVFVDETAQTITRIANEVNLDAIQLHGQEAPEVSQQLRSLAPQLSLIKAISANGSQIESLKDYPADAFLVDAYDSELRGGTGKVADWAAAKTIAEQLPRVFLAGGLSPENVATAINAVHPYGVDACSSLETSPGKKDAARMRAFVTAAHSVTLAGEGAQAEEGK